MHSLAIQVILITLGLRAGVYGFVLQQPGDSAVKTASGTTVLFPVAAATEPGSEGGNHASDDEVGSEDEPAAQEEGDVAHIQQQKTVLDDDQTSTEEELTTNEDDPAQNQDEVKVSLGNKDNQAENIFGQSDAEKLGDPSTLEVLFRKRRQVDCEESAKTDDVPNSTNEAPVEELPPPVPETSSAVEEVAPANFPEETPDDTPNEDTVVREETPIFAPKDIPISIPEDDAADVPEETPPSSLPEETPIVTTPEETPAIDSEIIVPKAPENVADKTDVSVEEVKLISLEEISNGELQGEGYGRSLDNNLPGTDFLAPPAETASCINYHAASPVDPAPTDAQVASDPPESADPPVTNLS